jgi:hypothetical protein
MSKFTFEFMISQNVNHESLVGGRVLVALCADSTIGRCATHRINGCLQQSWFVDVTFLHSPLTL